MAPNDEKRSETQNSICLNCFASIDTDRKSCADCGDVQFTPSALISRYPHPSLTAFGFDPHKPEDRGAAMLWELVDHPDWLNMQPQLIASMVEAAERPGWISGLICRASTADDTRRAEFLSQFRFLVANRRHRTVQNPSGAAGWRPADGRDAIARLAEQVASRSVTLAEATAILFGFPANEVHRYLDTACRASALKEKYTDLDLATALLVFRTGEFLAFDNVVQGAARLLAHANYTRGHSSLASAFARLAWILNSEKDNVQECADVLANICLIAKTALGTC